MIDVFFTFKKIYLRSNPHNYWVIKWKKNIKKQKKGKEGRYKEIGTSTPIFTMEIGEELC